MKAVGRSGSRRSRRPPDRRAYRQPGRARARDGSMQRDELQAAGHRSMSILQALRARCVDCCSGSVAEVRRCVSVNCPSWPFRMGFNPWRERRELSPERKAKLADALAKARATNAVA